MTKKTAKSTKVATKAQAAMPAEFHDAFLQDAGAGQETMDRDDYAIPRLAILQALSPQLQKQNSEYVPGAETGDIIDTVSNELHVGEVGITVVPVSYRRAYIEWKLRSEGGGFIEDHGSDGTVLNGCTKDELGRDITSAGNQIVTTAEYFAFVIDKETGSHTPVVISMSSTQLKKARRWNTLINQFRLPTNGNGGAFNPPMFARSYLLTTVPESNDRGSWFGWSIKPDAVLSQFPGGMDIYQAAKAFREKILSGEVKASQHQVDPANISESDDSPM